MAKEMLILQQHGNKGTIEALYKALASGDTDAAGQLLGADLEWWFHGPPTCQHMMRMLTGKTNYHTTGFRFNPRSMREIGNRVVVEGWEGKQAYWVHVWALKDGVIAQFREYFNTSLTVIRELRKMKAWEVEKLQGAGSPNLWQSKPQEHLKCSLPGLLLAI